jgi:putative membrane protein
VMWWYGDHMSGWVYGFMGLSSLIFWGLLIFGAVMLYRQMQRPGGGRYDSTRHADPERLLAQRYARGEIDEVAYRHALAVLRSNDRQSSDA